MSTSLSHLPEPAWKQEVNRRVAAHKQGKTASAEPASADQSAPHPGSRAAKAAARVARRFAKAPSYSEMLAIEARAAVEAAEAAATAAVQAHAKAQMVLTEIEAAIPGCHAEAVSDPFSDPFWGPQVAEVVPIAATKREHTQPEPDHESEPSVEHFAIRWEPDMPQRHPGSVATHASHGPGLFEGGQEDWAETEFAPAQPQEIAVIEPAQPIPGNVIEFPRQLVATRKMRPRLVEGPVATWQRGSQLSIFEVDPAAISTEPEAPTPAEAEKASPWTEPEWSSITLAPEPGTELDLGEEPEPEPQPAPAIELASLSRRLLATVVDATLIAGAVVSAAAFVAHNATALPGPRTAEAGVVFALLLATSAYRLLFFTLARATPGMKYARLALCTFDGRIPTRAQRLVRLATLVLSVLPIGLGFVWAVFDDQHLAWHDRISRTYLRLS